MTTSTNSDNSQQVPQLLQHERSTLPLLYLPYELAEETSLYFEPKEAARVLSVNRSFYNLFIPRAWHDLQYCCKYGDRKNLEEWFKKYGQYVRVVKPLRPAINQMEAIVDWIPFVNRATKLVALFDKRAPPDGITKILQYLQQIKSLRTVSLNFSHSPNALMEIVKMASAINELDLISLITIRFLHSCAMSRSDQWIKATEFVETLHSSKRSKVELEMNFDSSVTAQQVRSLAPYLTKLSSVDYREICMTKINRDIFYSSDTAALTFPRLEDLTMKLCRLHPQFYGFKDVTPSRIPRLRTLNLIQESCIPGHEDQTDANNNGLKWKPEFSNFTHVVVPSHHWPNLAYLRIGVISSERLMNIISLNPQLQYLTINPSLELDEDSIRDSTMFSAERFSHDVFKIDDILEQLPYLQKLTIAKLYSVVDVDSGSIPLERRRGIRIQIGSRMAVTPTAISYILQMQQLAELQLHQFVFTDVDETINLLCSCTGWCGVSSFTWYPIEWNHDLALAMTAQMPSLESFIVKECPKELQAEFEEEYDFSCYATIHHNNAFN